MKLIKPSFKIIPQAPGLEGIYKQIELAGRTCYKSEDKITEDSAKAFVDRMIKSGHGAMLEHGTVYFKIPANIDVASNFLDEIATWTKCKHITCSEGNWWAITTNLRVMVEHFAPEYIEELITKYLCEPTEYHEKRYTVKFVCDRGILAEFTRHRSMSFAAESTRYCNYSSNKFCHEITYIQPCWDYTKTGNYNGVDKFDGDYFEHSLKKAEEYYLKLLELGWKPQQARAILPNALKTELIMTGFASDWEHFFCLRTPNNAHPQARELAIPLKEEFITRKYI